MNGVALVLALSALGVDYSWRTTDEGQLEYVIQIEPEFIKALADGEEIHSDVPAEAGPLQRLCVRIGTTPAKHSAASVQRYKQLLVAGGRYASTDPAIPAPDAAPTIIWPARTLPEQSYNVTYGWQPDQAGQSSYYMQLDPALLQTLAAGDEIYASLDPAAGRVGRFVVMSGKKQLPRVAAQPVASTPPSLAVVDQDRTRFQPAPSTAPPAYNPPAGYNPPPAYSPPPTNNNDLYPRRPNRYGDQATDLRPPTGPVMEAPPPGGFNPSFNPPPAYNTPAPPAYADNRYQTPMQPPVDQYAPPPGYVQRTSADQPQVPRTSYAPPTYQQPLDNRVASVTREPPAGPLPAPQISNTNTSRPPSTIDADNNRWWPLMFTAFALFLSIGGNLYLGWTAFEFHSRYRLAIERLRSAGRP